MCMYDKSQHIFIPSIIHSYSASINVNHSLTKLGSHDEIDVLDNSVFISMVADNKYVDDDMFQLFNGDTYKMMLMLWCSGVIQSLVRTGLWFTFLSQSQRLTQVTNKTVLLPKTPICCFKKCKFLNISSSIEFIKPQQYKRSVG